MGIFPLTEHGKGSKKIAKAADKISSDCSLDLKGKARKGAGALSEARDGKILFSKCRLWVAVG